MNYRKMGSLGWEVSALGFGAMRLPMNQQMRVDQEESIKMIRYAIDNGVNYVDTAYPYHMGESEVVVGKALKDGYREKVHLATKSPVWMIKKAEDFDTYLNEQIKRLQTKPDIYLLHGLNRNRLEKIKNLNLIEKAEEAKRNGLIKYIGFSFHDNFETFKEIIDYYKWDCCQMQYNYLDIEYQAGSKGVQYAGSKGVALIIMEPVRGGKLAIPDRVLDRKPEIKEVLDKSKIKRGMPDWALQFVWNHPEVSVVLSGMSEMQQVVENVESANKSGINSLTKEELQTISELREAYSKYIVIPCTSCGYCLPCPNGVSIPNVLRLVNDLYYWGGRGRPRLAFFYNRMAKTDVDLEKRKADGEEVEGAATLCIQCGECLEKCPQQIDIPSCMEQANALFEDGKSISEVFK
ncbi:MAG: aldo/keto reductase [Promethearchaeota archaeon]|jgi:predicted aldo/keto reductase-like oxidoreductase